MALTRSAAGDVEVAVLVHRVVERRLRARRPVQIGRGRRPDDGRVAGDAVRRQVGHLFHDLVRIFGRSQVRAQAPLAVVVADEAEADQEDEASEPVAPQDSCSACGQKIRRVAFFSSGTMGFRTVSRGEHAADDSAAGSSRSVVDEGQHSPGRVPQFFWGVESDVGTGGGPDGRVGHALDQLERDHAPRLADVRDVQEAQDVAQQPQQQYLEVGTKNSRSSNPLVNQATDLDVTHSPNQWEAEEVGEDFRDVVHHRRHAEHCRRAAVVLQMEVCFTALCFKC